ncbi:MAG: hypothetical protein WA771_09550 [Chthoniobacterales bacterium]
MEQLVILVIIGLISLVNWLLERSAKHKEARRLEQRADGFDDESAATDVAERSGPHPDEQRRRFMEALGLPVDDPEPEMVAQREVQPPPIPEAREKVKRGPARNFLHKLSGDLEKRLVPEREVDVVAEQAITLKPVTRRQRTARKVVSPTAPGGQLDFIRERDGLRKAILAREILGPCKGLSFDNQ